MAVIAGLVLLATNWRACRIRPKQLLVMAILGVVGVAMLQYTYLVAVSLLPVGIALLLEYLAVLIVAVVAFFFLKERVKPRLWIAIALVLVGLAVVAQIWDSRLNALGVVMALGAAITLAVYFLVGERQVAATSPRGRVLDRPLRDARLGAVQRMAGYRPWAACRADFLGRQFRGGRRTVLGRAGLDRGCRLVPPVPAVAVRPRPSERDRGGHRRLVGG